MRFSYWPNSHQSWAQVLASSEHAERTGWDGLWFADHFVPSVGDEAGPYHECWTVLAALAAVVPRVRLGSLVTGNTYRNPALVLKMATTVDHLSGGRVVLGLGAGWQHNEHAMFGFDYGTVSTRADRLEEACALIGALRDGDRADFEGVHYRLDRAPLAPKPVQARLPLLVGGGGEQRTLRIVARYADEWNIWGLPAQLAAKGAVLDRRCEEAGRDPAEIARSAVALLFLSADPAQVEPFRSLDLPRPAIIGTPDEVTETVAGYRDAGVDELIIPDFNLPDPAGRHEALDLFQAEVAPHLR